MKYKLSEIMNLIGGGTPKTTVSSYWGGDIPWLSVKDFNNDSRYVYKTEKTITEEGLTNSSTRLLERDDSIISARGTVGEMAMIPYPMAFNQSCYGLRAKKDRVDPVFLYYLVKHNVHLLRKNSHGSVFDTITRDTFDGIDVDIPDMNTQCIIAGVLHKLDDKIELNMDVNDNLLQQAVAIFDKYYGAATRQQAFTSLINVLGGGTPKTSNSAFWNGTIPFFTPKDVGNPYTFQTEKYITDSGLDHCNSRLYPKNTSFVTARGTVGKVSLAGMPMAMNQSCYALASDVIAPILVYFYTLKAVASLKHKASGAVFDAIVTRDFDTETINVLSEDEAHTVHSVVAPLMEAIHNNTKENMQLATLRDSLLPRLMSGELDVADLGL
ncbi:MAG: restriction endonuclease subunit S [Lachnospiraceae bacterium]|nr:restriction endonuclease subunit S [Lachnospiraceae bacterium]